MEGDSRSFGKKSDIRDPAGLSDRAQPVCVVHQRSSPGSKISSCSIRGRNKILMCLEKSNQRRQG